MMLNEAQEAKWGQLLEAEGLDPIKDNHKRYVTGVSFGKPRKGFARSSSS